MDTPHLQTPATGATRSNCDRHTLTIIAFLSRQTTPAAFRAALRGLLALYIDIAIEAGWSQEAAEEFAESEIQRVSERLSVLRAHVIPAAGRC